MKRLFALLLLLAMVLSLAACPGNTPGGGGGGDDGLLDDPFIDGITEKLNFGGATFTISLADKYNAEVYYETEKPDAFDDAILRRNNRIEARFNVNIEKQTAPSYTTPVHQRAVLNAIQLGTVDFDMSLTEVWLSGPIASTGELYNLRTELPYVKDSIGVNDWWDSKINTKFSILGNQYLGVSDINVTAIKQTSCILFNNTMVNARNIPQSIGDGLYTNMYQVVRGGDWTLDTLYNVVKDLWIDNTTSGTGLNAVDEQDTFGLLANRWYTLQMLTTTTGIEFIINDGDSDPVLMNPLDNNFYGITRTIQDLFKSRGVFAPQPVGSNHAPMQYYQSLTDKFASGTAYFYADVLAQLESDVMHNTDVDFGVIPFPKASVDKNEYISATQDGMSVIGVPFIAGISQNAVKMKGAIVEALSAESHRIVFPAYYDVILTHDGVKNIESVEMVEMIYAGRSYNITSMYYDQLMVNVNGREVFLHGLMRELVAQDADPSSVWTSISGSAQNKLQAIVNDYMPY